MGGGGGALASTPSHIRQLHGQYCVQLAVSRFDQEKAVLVFWCKLGNASSLLNHPV